MKLLSSMKLGLVSAVFMMGLSGCINSNMIDISKTKDGQTQYRIYREVKPNVQNFRRYKDWNIHSYNMDITSVNNKVKVELEHQLGFTIGSGTPSAEYIKRYLYHGLKDFEIIGLKPLDKAVVSHSNSALISWWFERVSHTYSKKDFIDFVLKNDAPKIIIKASRLRIKSKNGNREIELLGVHNLKKFALCLENNETCVEKKNK